MSGDHDAISALWRQLDRPHDPAAATARIEAFKDRCLAEPSTEVYWARHLRDTGDLDLVRLVALGKIPDGWARAFADASTAHH